MASSSSYVISTNTDLFFFHRHSLPPKSLPTLFLIHHKKSPPILSLRSSSSSSSSKKRLSAIKAAANTFSAFNGFPTLQNPPPAAATATATEASFLRRLLSVLPGGSWWSLEEFDAKGGKGEKGEEEEEKSMPVMLTLRRMWVLIARERWVVALAFASLVLASITDLSIPHFLAAALFSAQSSERLVFYRSTKLLFFLCFSSAIFSGLRSCCFGFANMILVKRMRERLYHALLFQDMSFFDEETVGNLTSRLGSDCQQVSRVIGNDLNLITRSLLQGTGALIYLFILSWPLALSTVAICSVFGIILLFHGQYQKRAAKISQEFTAYSNEVSQESLSLMRTVRVYGTEEQEFGRYAKWLDNLFGIGLRQSFAYGYWSMSLSFLYHSTQVIGVLIGGISIMSGHITAEQLTKFLMYSERLIYSAWWAGDNWSSLMQSIGASEKVFRLMDLSPSKQFLSSGLKLQKMEGKIEFVDVSFHYPSRMTCNSDLYEIMTSDDYRFGGIRERYNGIRVQALHHINLSVHPNEVVAIVGMSGSGKSTMVSLLLRLYEPTDGQILIDGVPLRELDIKWLRERVGYVGQEPRLFRMDVSSNITYGCTRQIRQEEVEWAAKQAFAHEFILSLPNGYQTLVDDSLLSGGQKQRIAIARAILRDPTILVLDEATSALDAESEHYVKGILRNSSSAKRTVIVIAHRLSTIQAADRIVVMDSGRIVEMGNHKDLIHKDGLYARLNKRQLDAYEESSLTA